MSQVVILKKSNVVGRVPSGDNMQFGEVYVNYASGIGESFLSTKKYDGSVAMFREKEYFIVSDTTANWNAKTGYVPKADTIVVYTDGGGSYENESGETVNIPKIKIGLGAGAVQDLAFVNEDIEIRLDEHIADTDVHIQEGERTFWNNKLNLSGDTINDETIIFTRQ